jgi:hypothetical protein
MGSEVAALLKPVLLCAPPIGTTTLRLEVKGVEKMKLPEVAGPAAVDDMTA